MTTQTVYPREIAEQDAVLYRKLSLSPEQVSAVSISLERIFFLKVDSGEMLAGTGGSGAEPAAPDK